MYLWRISVIRIVKNWLVPRWMPPALSCAVRPVMSVFLLVEVSGGCHVSLCWFSPQSGHRIRPPVLQKHCFVLPECKWRAGSRSAVLPASRWGALQSRRIQSPHRLPSIPPPHRGGAGRGLLQQCCSPRTLSAHLWTSRKPLQWVLHPYILFYFILFTTNNCLKVRYIVR